MVLFTLFMFSLGVVILGAAIFPGVLFLHQLLVHTAPLNIVVRILYFCFGFVAGYFFSGIMLMFWVSLVRVIFRVRLKAEIFRWVFVNAFFMAVKVAFMDFILLTPYCAIFDRLRARRSAGTY